MFSALLWTTSEAFEPSELDVAGGLEPPRPRDVSWGSVLTVHILSVQSQFDFRMILPQAR